MQTTKKERQQKRLGALAITAESCTCKDGDDERNVTDSRVTWLLLGGANLFFWAQEKVSPVPKAKGVRRNSIACSKNPKRDLP
jgi:hypothetical protein